MMHNLQTSIGRLRHRLYTTDVVNFVLTMVFIFEMAVKLGSMGPFKYVTDAMNVFDAIVIILSLIELFMASSNKLSVFRAFRLLRILKLARLVAVILMHLFPSSLPVSSMDLSVQIAYWSPTDAPRLCLLS